MAANGTFKVAKVCNDAVLPSRGSQGAAGYDLSSIEECIIAAGTYKMIDTGIAIQIPPCYYARIAPRSGLALKHGINVFAGVVDSDYTGSIRVILMNSGTRDFEVKVGDRIAQLIFTKIETPDLIAINYDELHTTLRGASGFGSTGITS